MRTMSHPDNDAMLPFGALTNRVRCQSDRENVMWWGFSIVGFIIWVAIAFWPARVAGRKGHSFFGYFLLSLLFFPLSLIMAYMVHDRSAVAY
jgi:hypothetical protein